MTAKKKIVVALSCVLAVAAIVATSVMSTVAFLSYSAVVYNTFTVGDVKISLTESPVDAEGKKTTGDPVDHNTYTLVPNKTYDKDPVVELLEGSQDSYLFVHVKNNIENIAANDPANDKPTIALQLAQHGWAKYIKGATGWIYVYCGLDGEGNSLVNDSDATNETGWSGVYTAKTVKAGDKCELFKTFSIKAGLDSAQLLPYNSAEIRITAIAIQDDGFENIGAAWEVVHNTYPHIVVGGNAP